MAFCAYWLQDSEAQSFANEGIAQTLPSVFFTQSTLSKPTIQYMYQFRNLHSFTGLTEEFM